MCKFWLLKTFLKKDKNYQMDEERTVIFLMLVEHTRSV